MRTGLSIILGILTFFSVPFVVGLSTTQLIRQLGVENLHGVDRRQSITLAVILWFLIVTTGSVAKMVIVRLTSPRISFYIIHDPECRELLIELRQVNLNLLPTVQICLFNAGGQAEGDLCRHLTRDPLELLDPDQNLMAMILPEPVPVSSLNFAEILMFFVGLAISLDFWLPAFACSKRGRIKRYRFWSSIPGEAAGGYAVACLAIHPGNRIQNHVEVTGQFIEPTDCLMLLSVLALLSVD